MNRRTLLRAAPAAMIPLAAVGTSAAMSAAADPHPAWLVEWHALRAAWIAEFNKNDDDTKESDTLWAERERIERLIYTTPPKTLDGIRAQVAWVLEDSGGACVSKGHMEALTLTVGALR